MLPLSILLHEDMQLSGICQEFAVSSHKEVLFPWPIIRPEYSVRHLINTENHRPAESFDISWRIKGTIK